ncbi:MAG: VOC family protein [Chloroflexota bacterium]
MPQINGIAEVALYVDDINIATKFYEDVLGLIKTAQFGDSTFLQTGPNDTLILFQRDTLASRKSIIPGHGSEGQGHVALAISSEEIDAWRQHLINMNVEIEHEQDWSQGTHSIYFRDPDQNSIELIEARHYPAVWAKIQGQAS